MTKCGINLASLTIGLSVALFIGPGYVMAQGNTSEEGNVTEEIVTFTDEQMVEENTPVPDSMQPETAPMRAPADDANSEMNPKVDTQPATAEKPEQPKQEPKSLINIEVKDVPIVGDVNVKAVTKDENKSGHVAEVNTKDTSIVGDAHVGVVDRHAKEDAEGNKRVDEGVVEVNTKDTEILGNVHAGVIDHHSATDTEGNATVDEGVVNVDTADTEILDDLHIGVLDNHKATDGKGNATLNQGVVEAVIGNLPILGNMHAGVIDHHSATDTEGNATVDEGVVNVDAADTDILDDVHVGVLDNHEATDGKGNATLDQALAEVTTGIPGLLEDLHIGLLDHHFNSTPDGNRTQEGVLITGLNKLPILGDLQLGVLDRETETTTDREAGKESLLDLNLNNGLLDNVQVTLLGREWQNLISETPEVTDPENPNTETPEVADPENPDNGTGTPDKDPTIPGEDGNDGATDGMNPGTPDTDEGENTDGLPIFPEDTVDEGDVDEQNPDGMDEAMTDGNDPATGNDNGETNGNGTVLGEREEIAQPSYVDNMPVPFETQRKVKGAMYRQLANGNEEDMNNPNNMHNQYAATNRAINENMNRMSEQQKTLPKTGGFLDGSMLYMLAVILLGGGFMILRRTRKVNA